MLILKDLFSRIIFLKDFFHEIISLIEKILSEINGHFVSLLPSRPLYLATRAITNKISKTNTSNPLHTKIEIPANTCQPNVWKCSVVGLYMIPLSARNMGAAMVAHNPAPRWTINNRFKLFIEFFERV